MNLQLLEIDIKNGFEKKYQGKFTTAYKDVLPVTVRDLRV